MTSSSEARSAAAECPRISDSRVLFIYRGFHPIRGGVPKIIEEIGARLVAEGGEASVLTARLDRSPLHEIYRGIHVYRAEGFEKGHIPWKLLFSILERHRINRVMVSDPLREEAWLGWAARLVYRVPVMLNLAGSYAEAASRWQRWSTGILADSIVAISGYCKARYGFFPNRIQVVPMGTDLPTLKATTRRCQNLIATVGWVSRRKGYDDLLDTAKLLPRHRFLVAGNTQIARSYVEHLERRLAEERIDNVRLLGQISDRRLTRLLSRAKIFFLPTTHEMFGIAFLEAMAHGLPVVSRPVAAVPEAVTPDVSLLVDGAAAFAEAIERLTTDDALWERMSRAARKRAEDFTWERSYRAYRELLMRRVKTV
jgi:glycosyltransferase involved in cell wall biosynthesis